MKNNQRNTQFAFSLVEISVVVLIIGILIAGISKGVDLYQDFRLTTARKLTLNSRVGRITDLEIWFETTLENSLASGTTSYTNLVKPTESTPIGRWNNLNPNVIFNSRNHATQTNLLGQPMFVRNGINNLPSLSFDGSNDHFFYNGNFFVNSDYSIFIVEQRLSASVNNFFIAGFDSAVNQNLLIGYHSSGITQSNFGGSQSQLLRTVPTYSSPISRIHSFFFSKNAGKFNYVNGGSRISNVTQTTPIASYNGSSIGNAYNLYYYRGYFAEIIVYSRTLTGNERIEVESYLSQKWGIRLEN